MARPKKSYRDKLKDPRWQKKRLEILKRDDFTCKCCFDRERTLHVHHMIEDYDIEPWEHQDHDLVTLCEDCHSLWHKVFSIPVDPEAIVSIVKLYSRIESESIQRFIENKTKKYE